jgi:single-stranded DNA-binding protein
MNNCILMADIIQNPELRYTSDTQTPIAEMMVQFPGSRPEDPPVTLKVVGWGNLAQEIQANYHQGERVIIEGRLTMNTIDRPEGFKEKRAELTAQRLHRLSGDTSLTAATPPSESSVASSSPPAQPSKGTTAPRSNGSPKAKSPVTSSYAAPANPTPEPNLDDIPF